MANIFDELENTPPPAGNMFDGLEKETAAPGGGNIFDSLLATPPSGSGATPSSDFTTIPTKPYPPAVAPVSHETSPERKPTPSPKEKGFEGLIPLAENPVNFQQAGKQKEEKEAELRRAAAKVDSEALANKVKAGQPLTEVERYAWEMQSGQAIPTRELENIALLGAGVAAPLASVGAGTLGKIGGTALGEGLVGAGTNVALDLGEAASEGKMPDAKETALNALYGFVFGAAGGAAGGAISKPSIKKTVEDIAKETGEPFETVAENISRDMQTPEGANRWIGYFESAETPPNAPMGRRTATEKMEFVSAEGVKKAYFQTGKAPKGVKTDSPPSSAASESLETQAPRSSSQDSFLTDPNAPVAKPRMTTEQVHYVPSFRQPEPFAQAGFQTPETLAAQYKQQGFMKPDAPGPEELAKGYFADVATEGPKAMKGLALGEFQSGFGLKNRLFTQEAYQEASKALKKNAKKLRTGIDPEDIGNLVKVGGYYLEGGIREFAAWSTRMIDDFGEGIRPHLENIYAQSRKALGIEDVPGGSGPQPEGEDIIAGARKMLRDKPLTQPQIKKIIPQKYAGSMNLNRQKLSLGGREVLRDAGEKIGKTARPHAEMLKEAREIEMTPNDFLHVENPMAMTDAQKHKLREVVGAEAERLGKLSDDPNIPEEALDEDVLGFMDLVAKDVYVGSETGRTLAQRALDIVPGESLTQARLRAFEKLLKSDKKEDKTWLLKQARLLLKAGDANKIREIMYDALTSRTRKITDALESAIINGYLSSPTTWVKVHVSQGLYTLERALAERPLAAGVDAALSAIRGTTRTRHLKDSLIDLAAMKDALPEAAYYLTESAKAQRQIFTEDVLGKPFLKKADFGAAFDFIPGGKKAGDVLGRIVQIPGGTMIGAGDDAVKVLNYRATINVEAHRIARHMGLKGDAYDTKVAELISKPTSEMTAKAASEAFEKAMQRPLSKPALAIQNLRDALPVGGRIINPFITVADSTIRSVYERTPLYIISLLKNRKNLTQGEVSDAVARMLIGSIIAGGAYTLAERGMLTGGTPTNEKDRQAWYATGRKPYSLITPDGKVIPMSAFEPASTLMGIMADYHDLSKYADDDAAWKIGWYVFARNIFNKSYMEGLSNFLGAVHDPGKAEAAFEKQAAGALVPQIAYRTAGIMDPTLRDPQNLTQAFQRRIPGQSDKLPPIRDIWGQPVMDLGNPVSKMVNPFRMKELSTDPATIAVFENKARIISPSESISKIPMTLDEYEQLVEAKGRIAKEEITDYVTSEQYRLDTPEERKEEIESIDKAVNRDAREWIEDIVYERVRNEGYSDEDYEDMKKGYMDLPKEMKK